MIETLERSSTANVENMIKAAADYLRENPVGRLAEPMRAELIDLISGLEKVPYHVVQNAMRSGDIEVARVLKARGVTFEKCPSMRSMSAFSFSHVPTATRTALFKLLSQDIHPETRSVRRVICEAFSVRDPDLVDAVLEWAPDESFDDVLWSTGRLEISTEDAPLFWRSMVDRIDPESEATQAYAQKFLTVHPAARSLAILAAKGVRLGPIITRTRVIEQHATPWLLRLRRRAGSAHGELELIRTLPAIDEILTMPQGHLEVMLAGLSNNQKRKLRRAERKGKIPQSLKELLALVET